MKMRSFISACKLHDCTEAEIKSSLNRQRGGTDANEESDNGMTGAEKHRMDEMSRVTSPNFISFLGAVLI